MDKANQGYSKRIIFLTIGLILTGAASTIIFKYQTKIQGLPKTAISLQTFFVIFSQFINLIIFFIKITLTDWRLTKHFRKYRNRSLSNGRKYQFKSTIIIWSSVFSCIASLFQLYALYSLTCGFYQMFMGMGIIFAPILSSYCLRRRLYPHVIAGIGICTFAFLVIILSAYFLGFSGLNGDTDWKVLLFMLLGVFLSSCQRVYQEYVNSIVEISPFRFSGLEGLYSAVILFVFHLIMLAFNYLNNTQYFDIASEMMYFYTHDEIVISSILLMICICTYDLIGISLVSKTGATYRVTNDVIRIIFVWGFEIVLYDLNVFSVKYWINFSIIIFAYAILVYGNLVINEIVVIKFFGLDKYYGLYRKTEEIRGENNSDSLDDREIERNIPTEE